MRISDWSSDVCSSDLRLDQLFQLRALRLVALRIPFAKRFEMLAQPRDRIAERPGARFLRGAIGARIVRGTVPFGAQGAMLEQRRDRKSVVSGKSVSVRVDLGGSRVIQKNKTNQNESKQ